MTTTDPTMIAAPAAAKINRYYDPVQAKKDLETFNTDINVDLMRCSGLYAYYNALLVKAENQYDRLVYAAKKVEAKLGQDYRAEASRSGTKLTEVQLSEKIAINVQVDQLQGLIREAKAEMGYLKGTCYALSQRKDTLLQVARNMTAEIRGATVMEMKENRNERVKQILNGISEYE